MPETSRPSTGTTSPCLTSNRSPGSHLPDRHRRERAVLVAVGAARRAFEQRGELPVRASVREVLEGPPGREHERDHGAGQVLLERERAAHREDGDQVHAGLAVQDARSGPPTPMGTIPIAVVRAHTRFAASGSSAPHRRIAADHDAEESTGSGRPRSRSASGVSRHRPQARVSSRPTCHWSSTPSIAMCSSNVSSSPRALDAAAELGDRAGRRREPDRRRRELEDAVLAPCRPRPR